MSPWLRYLILAVLIGATKAAHMRLIVLGILGLAGLWMMQSMAQGSGRDLLNRFSAAEIATRILSKRSTSQDQIDWDKIITNDVSTCARSFLCQLSSTPSEQLTEQERQTLDIISRSTQATSWASRQAAKAIQTGLRAKGPSHCRKIFVGCPYSSDTMQQLLTLLGDRS